MSGRNPTSPVAGRVYLSTVCSMFSYAILVVVLPFRFESLGLSLVDYGLALAIYALGMLVTEGLWGAAAFRLGRPRPLLALGGAVGVVIVAIGLSRSFVELALTLGVYGGLVVFPVPLGRWLALTAGGPGTSGRGTGRYVFFFGIGLALGSALGPALYATLGFFFVAMLSLAAFAASVVLLAFLPWERAGLPPRSAGLFAQMPRVFTRHFAVCATLVSLAYLAFTMPSNFLQYYSVGLFHGTGAESGVVIGALRATQMVAGFLLGSQVDRFGPSRSVPFGFLVLAAGAAGTFFAQTYGEMVLATLVFAVGSGWLFASFLPLALEPVPADQQGATVGIFGSFEDLGLLVGPIVISAVYSARGPEVVFLTVVAVTLVGAGIAAGARWIGLLGPQRLPSAPGSPR